MDAVSASPDLTPEQRDELAAVEAKIVPGRTCGSCTLCCKVVSIAVLDKPAGEWCRHCKPGRGCGIYLTRPYVCRGHYCEWMTSKGLGPEWKPERAKFSLVKSNGGRRLTAHVDPGNASAWRRSPYYENFKQWAREAAQKTPEMHVVDIMIGQHCIIVLPDREVDLGIISGEETIVLNKRTTPTGDVVIEVERSNRATAA